VKYPRKYPDVRGILAEGFLRLPLFLKPRSSADDVISLEIHVVVVEHEPTVFKKQ
jgi:hypothetical protein